MLDLPKVIEITNIKKQNVSHSHTKSPSQYGMAPVLQGLCRTCLLEPLLPTHGGLTLQQDFKCGIEKRIKSNVTEAFWFWYTGKWVAIAQLAVDKITTFVPSAYIYITVYCTALQELFITSILPTPPTPTFFSGKHDFKKPPISERNHQTSKEKNKKNQQNATSLLFTHPKNRRATFVNFSLAFAR